MRRQSYIDRSIDGKLTDHLTFFMQKTALQMQGFAAFPLNYWIIFLVYE